MSTIRNSSSNEDAKRAEAAQEARRAQNKDIPRQPPAPESVDEFRNLLQQRQSLGLGQKGLPGEEETPSMKGMLSAEGEGMAEESEQRLATDRGRHQAAGNLARQQHVGEKSRDDSRYSVGFDRGSGDSQPSAESSAMWQAQLAMRSDNAAPAAPMQPNSNAAAFADLIERHVRQLAVGQGGANGEESQVLLRLSDQTLPGTDLLLTKTAAGWQLRADSRSRSSFDAIREASPELMRRFAERNLGQLSIDPHFHD
ncbi:hypothetical protein [Pseudomonas sp. CGJS7]|uniref:hypothetical protein n=1 Tax=Pseudomonas sp. CGJS7 TaxID=3109348 RepID=UPI003009A624